MNNNRGMNSGKSGQGCLHCRIERTPEVHPLLSKTLLLLQKTGLISGHRSGDDSQHPFSYLARKSTAFFEPEHPGKSGCSSSPERRRRRRRRLLRACTHSFPPPTRIRKHMRHARLKRIVQCVDNNSWRLSLSPSFAREWGKNTRTRPHKPPSPPSFPSFRIILA